eukprot:6367840-Pyramimonas_sp.AAC.1
MHPEFSQSALAVIHEPGQVARTHTPPPPLGRTFDLHSKIQSKMASFAMHAKISPVVVSSGIAGRQAAPERASMPSAKVFAKGARSASLRASAPSVRP